MGGSAWGRRTTPLSRAGCQTPRRAATGRHDSTNLPYAAPHGRRDPSPEAHRDRRRRHLPYVIATRPAVGVVLGSGLGGFGDSARSSLVKLPYDSLPHLPVSRVPGHQRQPVLCARSTASPWSACRGGCTTYEGHSIDGRSCTAPGTMAMLGVDPGAPDERRGGGRAVGGGPETGRSSRPTT